MQVGADFAQIGLDVLVVVADDAVDANVECLRLIHLKQLTHQGNKAGFRLARDGCFHGRTRWVCMRGCSKWGRREA